jgi:outer membrane protein assembly factor BamB
MRRTARLTGFRRREVNDRPARDVAPCHTIVRCGTKDCASVPFRFSVNDVPDRSLFAGLARAIALGSGISFLGGCSSGSTALQTPRISPTATAPPAPAPVPVPAATALPGDDWVTFAHDYKRTGLETNNTTITAKTVARLALKWKANVGGGVYDSPLVYAGNVIVATVQGGTVYDFSASTGKLLWTRTIGNELRATPSIADGLVFVGNRLATSASLPLPSYLYALRLLDGSIAWRAPLNGVTHGSPVVANGKVFIGTAGGDPPQCIDGGITALDESTGAQIWKWEVNPQAHGGGSVWGAVSYDGTYLLFGTGNTCQTPIMTANGAAALTTDGTLAWSFVANRGSYVDDDTGSGVLVTQAKASFINKDGSFFSLDPATGRMLAKVPLGAVDQRGGFTTPTSDGTTVLVGVGYLTDAASAAQQRSFCVLDASGLQRAGARRSPQTFIAGSYSKLEALDQSGSVVWSKRMNAAIDGYAAAIANGMAFTELDNEIVALNLTSGTTLWSYQAQDSFEASPVLVKSGLYAADNSGNVYAFSIPVSTAAVDRRSVPGRWHTGRLR